MKVHFIKSRAFCTSTWGSNQHHVGITQYLILCVHTILIILHVQHQARNDGSIGHKQQQQITTEEGSFICSKLTKCKLVAKFLFFVFVFEIFQNFFGFLP